MKALEAIHSRISSPRLVDPAPSDSNLEQIFRAAFRAADHGLLRPWRFLTIQGESRSKLGELFVRASAKDNPDLTEAQLEKIRSKPLRAPMLIVTISSIQEHPKVPAFEQDLSAAAATQNMLIAAHAQDVGAMWRTGSMAYHPEVMAGLGLRDNEKIIGFLYLGTHDGPRKPIRDIDLDEFVQAW